MVKLNVNKGVNVIKARIALQRCIFNTTGSKSGIVTFLTSVALTSTDNLLRIKVVGSVRVHNCRLPSSTVIYNRHNHVTLSELRV